MSGFINILMLVVYLAIIVAILASKNAQNIIGSFFNSFGNLILDASGHGSVINTGG